MSAQAHGIASFRDQIRYLRDCADGLQYLHALDILHRDIKPQNIGIVAGQTRRRAILLDLGHAIESNISSDHMKGTVRYLAPEIIALKHKHSTTPYDDSSDMFSLGLSFWEVNCGRVDWNWLTEKHYQEHVLRTLNEKQAAYPRDREAALVLEVIESLLSWVAWKRPSAKTVLAKTEPHMPQKPSNARKRSPGEPSTSNKAPNEPKRPRDEAERTITGNDEGSSDEE